MDKEEKEKIWEEYRLFIKELTGEDLADNDERGSLFSWDDVFGAPIYSDPYKVGDKVEVSEFIVDESGDSYVEYVGEGVIEEIDARRPKGNRYRVSINGEDYFTGEVNLGPALDAIEGLYFSPNDSCPSFIEKSSERGNKMDHNEAIEILIEEQQWITEMEKYGVTDLAIEALEVQEKIREAISEIDRKYDDYDVILVIEIKDILNELIID